MGREVRSKVGQFVIKARGLGLAITCVVGQPTNCAAKWKARLTAEGVGNIRGSFASSKTTFGNLK